MSEATLVVPKAISTIPRSPSPVQLSDAPGSAPSTPSPYLDPLSLSLPLSPGSPSSRRSSISSADRLVPSRRLTTQRSQPLLTVKSPLLKRTGRTGSRRGSTGTEGTDTSSDFCVKFAPTKRSQYFHTLFSNIPEDERLIDDYGCALQKDMLHHGRLYMSEHHLCFYANIFGWVTNLVIPFEDIESIDKRATAIFIPNAILVSTGECKYFFASLLSRDQVYERLIATWEASRGETLCGNEEECAAPLKADDASWTTGIETEDGSDTDDDEQMHVDSWNDQIHSTMTTQPFTSIAPIDDLKNRMDELPAEEMQGSLGGQSYPHTQEFNSSLKETALETHPAPTEAPRLEAHIQKKTDCICMKTKEHFPIEVLNQTYHGSIEKIYNLLYNSRFLEVFLKETEKSTDVNIGPWEKSDGNVQYTRDVSFIKYLGGTIGPRSTKCLLKEEIHHRDMFDSVTLVTTTQTPNVPSGSAFSIKNRVCISWEGKDTVRVLVTMLVEFSKSSWLKSTIEKASIDGQISYYRNLDAAIRAKLQPLKHDATHTQRRKKKGKRRHRPTLEEDKETFDKKERLTQILDTAQTAASDCFTWVSETIRASNLSRISIFCAIFTVVMHLYIVHKLATMNHLLHELKGTDHTTSKLNFERVPHTLETWHRTQRQDINTMWQQIQELAESGKTSATPFMAQQDARANSPRVTFPAPNSEEPSDSQTREDPVFVRVEELGNLVQKAGQSMDYVSLLVEEQRQRLLQEWTK